TSNQWSQAVPQSVVDAIGFTGGFTGLDDCARSYPGITLNPFSRAGGPVNDITTSNIPTREVTDSLTLIRGKHTLMMGGDYRFWIQKRNLNADYLGDFTYRSDLINQNGSSNGFIKDSNGNPVPPNGCPTPACGTANAIADFLLGYYQSVGIFLPGPFSQAGQTGNLNQYHFTYYAPFVQDDWKVSSRLTLNLGLRWDFTLAPDEKYGRLDYRFDPNAQPDPSAFPELANYKGGLTFAGAGGNPRKAANTNYGNIQPRIGVAYQLRRHLVLRGGWGRYFANPNNNWQKTTGFSTSTTLTSSNDGGRTPIPGLLSNPYPNGILTPTGSSRGAATFVGSNFSWFNPDFTTPSVDQ